VLVLPSTTKGGDDVGRETARALFRARGSACAGKVDHRLIDILVIAVCAVIACAESWEHLRADPASVIGGA